MSKNLVKEQIEREKEKSETMVINATRQGETERERESIDLHGNVFRLGAFYIIRSEAVVRGI